MATAYLLVFAVLIALSTAIHGEHHQRIMANPKSLNGTAKTYRRKRHDELTALTYSLQDTPRILLKLPYDGLHEERLL